MRPERGAKRWDQRHFRAGRRINTNVNGAAPANLHAVLIAEAIAHDHRGIADFLCHHLHRQFISHMNRRLIIALRMHDHQHRRHRSPRRRQRQTKVLQHCLKSIVAKFKLIGKKYDPVRIGVVKLNRQLISEHELPW